MRLVYMTCTAMCANGAVTDMGNTREAIRLIRKALRKARQGLFEEEAITLRPAFAGQPPEGILPTSGRGTPRHEIGTWAFALP